MKDVFGRYMEHPLKKEIYLRDFHIEKITVPKNIKKFDSHFSRDDIYLVEPYYNFQTHFTEMYKHIIFRFLYKKGKTFYITIYGQPKNMCYNLYICIKYDEHEFVRVDVVNNYLGQLYSAKADVLKFLQRHNLDKKILQKTNPNCPTLEEIEKYKGRFL